MEPKALSCPQCGGSLDPSTIEKGLAQCVHCDGWALLADDKLQKIEHYALPSARTHDELVKDLETRLGKSGLSPIPPFEAHTDR